MHRYTHGPSEVFVDNIGQNGPEVKSWNRRLSTLDRNVPVLPSIEMSPEEVDD
jgi:hypothetical protein